jgi:hypothetical protein
VRISAGFELFAEAPGRAFIVSGPEAGLEGLRIIGHVGGPALELDAVLKIAVSELAEAHERGLFGFL